MCSCVDTIFNNYDYNNIPIKINILKSHNNKDNAWIAIDRSVYSIRKDDILLLNIFKKFYGKDVKDFILNDTIFSDIKQKILILENLKKRKIGNLID